MDEVRMKRNYKLTLKLEDGREIVSTNWDHFEVQLKEHASDNCYAPTIREVHDLLPSEGYPDIVELKIERVKEE